MIIKLFQPPTKSWVLIAEQLDDPPTRDRFLPSHSATSQRWQFESTAKVSAAAGIKLKPCKDLLRCGTSAFEYDWQTEEDEILCHAMLVAESLGLELIMDAPTAPGSNSGRSAA